MGVIVGVAVIVTMVSFGLGLQSNMLARFKALDLFNEVLVFGRGLSNLAGLDRPARARDEGERRDNRGRSNRTATRILDDAGVKELAAIPGVAYVEPNVNFPAYVRANGKLLTHYVGGANIPNAATRFQSFAAGKMISSPTADEAVVSERFVRDFGFEKPADAVGKTLELLAPPDENSEDEEEEETPNFFGIPLDDSGFDESRCGTTDANVSNCWSSRRDKTGRRSGCNAWHHAMGRHLRSIADGPGVGAGTSWSNEPRSVSVGATGRKPRGRADGRLRIGGRARYRSG